MLARVTSGEPGNSSRLERARHGDDEHDAKARPAPAEGPVDIRLEVVDELVRDRVRGRSWCP